MQTILLCMSGYPSKERESILRMIDDAIEKTYVLLSYTHEDQFPSIEELERIGVYKRKYVPYSAFFSAITSHPVLSGVARRADLINVVLAKLAAIMSIKVLDNINDDLHTIEEAAESIEYQECAFLDEKFSYRSERGIIPKAENWTYLMARWTHDILSSIEESCTLSRQLLEKDMRKYMLGQKGSFRQKVEAGNKALPENLEEYLSSGCEKGIGNIWFDMDLCFYEKNLGTLDDRILDITLRIRNAVGLAFKSFLIYDDVSDIRDDLSHRIVNGVILYAADHGIMRVDAIDKDIHRTLSRLEKSGVLRDMIQLGDLMFLKAIRYLDETETESSRSVDIREISFALRVLRAFTMRKWVFEDKSFVGFGALTRSFQSSDKIGTRIAARLLEYDRLLDLPEIRLRSAGGSGSMRGSLRR